MIDHVHKGYIEYIKHTSIEYGTLTLFTYFEVVGGTWVCIAGKISGCEEQLLLKEGGLVWEMLH